MLVLAVGNVGCIGKNRMLNDVCPSSPVDCDDARAGARAQTYPPKQSKRHLTKMIYELKICWYTQLAISDALGRIECTTMFAHPLVRDSAVYSNP